MYDDFEEEMDEGPQGSILKPIFLGCGAMGVGCVFSLGAILIILAVFVPNLWTLINTISEDGILMEETLPMVMANEQVLAAVGEPVETNFVDLDIPEDEEANIIIGEEINLVSDYTITGPQGSAQVRAEGGRNLSEDSEWTITTLTVRLEDGTLVHIVPNQIDVPPAPAQLAPPETPVPSEPARDEPTED